MTASVRASVPNEQPTRRIIGWLDDYDDRTLAATGDVEGYDWPVAPFGAEAAPTTVTCGDVLMPPDPTYEAAGPATVFADRRRAYDRAAGEGITGILATHFVAHSIKTFGTAATSPVWAAASDLEPDWVSIAPILAGIAEHRDFYSSALPDLAQLELTIESINESMRESMKKFVQAYVRSHGHAYLESIDDDFESAGLAYTDHLGDYPPLAREYENVEVAIGSEDEIERPVYTDEDYQVWGM